MATQPPPLLYADTVTSTDQLYFSRVSVHDPFIAFSTGKKRITVQSALELGRIKKARSFDEVLPLEEWRAKAQARHPAVKAAAAEVIAELARAYKVSAFTVPADFPTALYLRLTELGLKLHVAHGELFPEREVKNAVEARAIREGNRLSAVGFTTAENVLRSTRIKGRDLLYQGKPLTSERLRFAIDCAILAEGGKSDDTIVAGGDQACDPHERGSGPLRANELIILDIFPRVVATGYYGDMTRTYLKGRASDAQRKLYTTVHAAQRAALTAIRAGIDGGAAHQKVVETFDAAGYETKHGKNGSTGFFHGTGHGLGLAIHEAPRLSFRGTAPLKKGAVVTVEPGLYYPGLGGCRIEDVVQVTSGAPKFLSSHPYDWEIR